MNLIKLILLATIFFHFFNVEGQIWSNDPSFNVGGSGAISGGNYGNVQLMARQTNGKIIIAGNFTEYNGVLRHGIARLNADGSVDSSFVLSDSIPFVSAFKLDSQERLIVCQQGKIERYLQDGQLDTSFDASALQIMGQVAALYVQTDGKIIAAGSMNYTNINSFVINSILRLNEDGSLDPTFTPVAATDIFNLEAVNVQSDGKIVVAGSFNSFAGSTYCNIMRFNTDGSIDYTFNSGNTGPNNFVKDIYIGADDKIVVGGNFNMYNGIACDAIIRLNPNGDVDSTFDLNMPILGTQIAQMTNFYPLMSGKLLVLGGFYSPGSTIFRMNENGSVDTSFVIYTGGNDEVLNCIEQPDGNLMVCGLFSTFGSVMKKGITRISEICGDILTTEYITASANYYWPANGINYTASGAYSTTFTGINGCDSLVTLNLIIDSIYLNTVVSPTPDSLCTGELYVTASGNPPFQFMLNGLNPSDTNANYAVFNNLCAGYYDLITIDATQDTLSTTILIPTLDNYFTNSAYADSSVIDSLGTIINNCDIFNQGNIDSVFIQDIYATNNTLFVSWHIYSDTILTVITTNYILDSIIDGVYTIQLTAMCQQKSNLDYFVANYSVYFSTYNPISELTENTTEFNFVVYPNPTDNAFYVSFAGEGADLSITDANGKLLYTDYVTNGAKIDLSNFQQGIYFLELRREGRIDLNRLIKR